MLGDFGNVSLKGENDLAKTYFRLLYNLIHSKHDDGSMLALDTCISWHLRALCKITFLLHNVILWSKHLQVRREDQRHNWNRLYSALFNLGEGELTTYFGNIDKAEEYWSQNQGVYL